MGHAMDETTVMEYERQALLVRDWAARNGLSCSEACDGSLGPEYEPTFLNVTIEPRPDSRGVVMARATVASLMVRHLRTLDGSRILRSSVTVHLTRHGRGSTTLEVSADELQRFGLEARHLDRID